MMSDTLDLEETFQVELTWPAQKDLSLLPGKRWKEARKV